VKNSDQPVEAVLAERLVKAAELLEGDSVGDPLAVAALQERLGVSLTSLGFADRAIPILQKSRQTRQESLGPDHAHTISSRVSLALSFLEAGKLDLAAPLFEKALPLAKAKLGSDHIDTLRCMNGLAEVYLHARKLDLALPLLAETLKLRKAKLGPDHPDTVSSMNNLAVGYELAGKFDLSLPLKEETHRLDKARLGPDHLSTLTSMNNLAEGYRVAGKLDLALPLFEETYRSTLRGSAEAPGGNPRSPAPGDAGDRGQPRGELRVRRPAGQSAAAARRGLPGQQEIPWPALGWRRTRGRLRAGG